MIVVDSPFQVAKSLEDGAQYCNKMGEINSDEVWTDLGI